MYKTLAIALAIIIAPVTLNAQEPGSKSRNEKSKQTRSRDLAGQHVQAFFSRMDRNGDGLLSPSELPQRLKNRLQQVDADKNGQISKEEFAAAAAKRRTGSRGPGKQGKQKNGKSGFSQGRGNQGMMKNVKEQMQDPDMWIKRFDRNGDQVISKDEMPKKLQQRFAKIDKNGNDQLEKNEIVAVIEMRKAEGGMKSSRYGTDSSKTKPQLPKRPSGG